MIGQRHNHLRDVFDHDDRQPAVGQLLNQADHLGLRRGVEARDHLVQKQQPGSSAFAGFSRRLRAKFSSAAGCPARSESPTRSSTL